MRHQSVDYACLSMQGQGVNDFCIGIQVTSFQQLHLFLGFVVLGYNDTMVMHYYRAMVLKAVTKVRFT